MKDTKKQDELKKIEKHCEEYLDGWKRAKAELINYKKDVEKRNSELREFMAADLLLDILPIHGHFKKALKHIPEEDRKKDWVAGIIHIKSQLDKFLRERGVTEIKTCGEKFNPEIHEAVSQRKSEGHESGIVLEECGSGYTVDGKVITPAKVIVAE